MLDSHIKDSENEDAKFADRFTGLTLIVGNYATTLIECIDDLWLREFLHELVTGQG